MNKQGTIIQAYFGHLLDLWRVSRMQIRNPHSLTKLRQIKSIGRKSKAKVFLETGTYLGNTAMRCSYFFEKVVTIEVDPTLFETSRQYLSRRPNIETFLGDAVHVIPELMEQLSSSQILVYLDGHFSSGVTGMGDEPEPACREIEILSRYEHRISSIIVDDFRCFGTEKGFPRKSELLCTIERCFPGFESTVNFDQLVSWRANHL